MRYSWSMKIRHKGLRALHERDDRSRLPASLVPRLRRILFRLQEATHPGSADAPGFRLHPLKGDRAGQWSVRASWELARGVPLRGRRGGGRGPSRLPLTGRRKEMTGSDERVVAMLNPPHLGEWSARAWTRSDGT